MDHYERIMNMASEIGGRFQNSGVKNPWEQGETKRLSEKYAKPGMRQYSEEVRAGKFSGSYEKWVAHMKAIGKPLPQGDNS